ncbi:hypothetical protein AB0J82_14455 [Asanoa sp. NPDC049518]|uniref:hypothetical protein n=1 Tax=unclassified Asanoa TaxID=2685164 RepID=UPI003444E56E
MAYPRSGTCFVAAAGFSTCRFCAARNGSVELTDGEHFIWPDGLAHYVETHQVSLPPDVRAVAARGLAAPFDSAALAALESDFLDSDEAAVDIDWWLSQSVTT